MIEELERLKRRVEREQPVSPGPQTGLALGGSRRSEQPMHDEVVDLTKQQEVSSPQTGRREFDRRCGMGDARMGPFYCPLDQKIYVDLSFYQELRRRFKAPGDFAQAYVIAHEVGHHVQTLLGIAGKVQQMKQRYPGQANKIQVRMELQADCLSGVWANLNDQLKS